MSLLSFLLCLVDYACIFHLIRFEENNMIRLSRKRKSYDAGRSNRQEMDELTDFTELGSLTQDMRDHSLRKKYKQSSSTKKAKSTYV